MLTRLRRILRPLFGGGFVGLAYALWPAIVWAFGGGGNR